ncbi:hypothetical protein BJ170DRAFT_594436 [Xylariales sp. AK1849]|nr:hypothetical protein BJ170DRAFT_594436 [Xylariales sp. AK1849]
MATGETKPSISARKYIKWADAPPSEPTSTLVLTSPQRRFVDVRLLLLLLPSPLPVAEQSIPTNLNQVVDWAFAGSLRLDPASEPPHAVFEHWVDSRHADAERVRDEGDMYPGEREGEEVERGAMVNPATGAVEAYEECWVDGLAESRAAAARDAGGMDGGWVLRWESEAGRGMMVRIGALVQGVLRVGGEVGVGRWKGGEGPGGWEGVAEVGAHDGFPVLGAQGVVDVKVGVEVTAKDGRRWECIESW